MSLRGALARKPVSMAGDDEVGVLHAVERDLSSHYSGRFCVVAPNLVKARWRLCGS